MKPVKAWALIWRNKEILEVLLLRHQANTRLEVWAGYLRKAELKIVPVIIREVKPKRKKK